jgi:hypothetical protein
MPQLSTDAELEEARLEFEKAKWQADDALRRDEINLKREEQERSRWVNPLVIAVFAAAAAAFGNAGVTLISGYQQQQLEQSRAEAARILEVVKTNDQDQAAANLKFLIDNGLITDQKISRQIQAYLDTSTHPQKEKGLYCRHLVVSAPPEPASTAVAA